MAATIDSIPPDKAFLARWTYEQLASLRDQTLGPALRMPEYYFSVYDLLMPAIESIVGPHRHEDVGNVIEVPTPWHAVLILDSLQHHLCLEKRRAVFRGQANSDWAVSPSLARPGVDVPKEEYKASLFCDIFKRLSFNQSTTLSPRCGRLDLQIPSDSYLAAAQHYGIKTNLIDYTPDPAVAVYFAAAVPRPESAATSSVYVMSLDHALENGCEIIVPPPFVERLHLQRGFFIKHMERSLPLDREHGLIAEVRFPVDYSFSPFRVVRRGIGEVDLLPPNPEVDSILKTVHSTAETLERPEAGSSQYLSLLESANDAIKRTIDRSVAFSGFYHDPLVMWARYLDAFEDMLYWTAYYADATNLTVDQTTLANIVRANGALCSSVVQLYRWMRDDPSFECSDDRKNFIDQITTLLSSPQG